MLATVVIPTYKGTKNLLRAVKSALNQTITDLEVIVVDDNGKDTVEQKATEKLLSENISDARLKYIALEKNSGGSAARNKGASVASGKFINFLDDDDAIESTKIETQINALTNVDSSYGLAYSSSRIYSDGVLSNVITPTHSGDILYDFLMGKIKIGTGTVLISRDVWYKLGGYDESFVRHQDWEFFARVLSNYKAIATPTAFFERYITNRNLPANVTKAEEYADHYIGFLKCANLNISAKQLKKVINYNNSRIAWLYLKQKNMKKVDLVLGKYDFKPKAVFSFVRFICICLWDKLRGVKS